MNRSTEKYGVKKVVFAALVMSVALLCVLTLLRGPSVVQAADTPQERELKELAHAFRDAVDIYLDVGQIQAGQPFIAGVEATGLRRVAGVTFIRFQNNKGERWNVDPDRIIACRVHQKK